jgi:hypothetical protein
MPAPSFHDQNQNSLTSGSDASDTDKGAMEAKEASGKSKFLYGQVGVSELLSGDEKQQLGFKTNASRDGITDIIGVREDSPAFKGGLQVGDHVTHIDRRGDLVALTVETAGRSKVIELSLQATGAEPNLSLRIPRPDNTVPEQTPFTLNANKLAAFVESNREPMLAATVSETSRFLARYDVELIVDASMSMKKPDCPGFMSRWDWCGAQSVALARQLAPFARQGITMTSFNNSFDVYEHQSPEQITNLFARTNLAFQTRLAEPLADRLNDYLVHRQDSRPRLIAVITDGVPHPREEVQMVIDVLVHASQMLKDPREVTVVFFQIGSRDLPGQQFLFEIDNNLIARGARFDIVQTVSFEHLKQVGLAQGLADAIKNFDYKTR